MIHYHGTPVGGTRQDGARFLAGRHALVPLRSWRSAPMHCNPLAYAIAVAFAPQFWPIPHHMRAPHWFGEVGGDLS